MGELNTGPDALVDEAVTLINALTVPAAESERFLSRWRDNARIMAAQPGFVRARLHVALDDTAQPRFVNVAEWASGTALDAARADPRWRSSARRLVDDPDLHVTAAPSVYQVRVEVHPGAAL